jgi:hypothetical protein
MLVMSFKTFTDASIEISSTSINSFRSISLSNKFKSFPSLDMPLIVKKISFMNIPPFLKIIFIFSLNNLLRP